MTFSLAGRCARTGQLGAIVTSSSPAVAARCAWARAGAGAVCTQNVTDPSLGPKILDELQNGSDARQALDMVIQRAAHSAYRQLAVVDTHGNTASFSGANSLGRYRTVETQDAVAAGNLLSSDTVPQAMVEAFHANLDADIGDRLLAALRAGADAGGEEGPVHSCGMMIVDQDPWPLTDLRVDWSENPLDELAEAWRIWKPQARDYATRALNPQAAPSYGVPGDQ